MGQTIENSRNMVKLILADNFFPGDDANRLFWVTKSLPFVQKEYGQEIDNFNLIQPGLEPVFNTALGSDYVLDEERSGVFRQSMTGVHFEGFDAADEWCFAISLDPMETVFNYYSHSSGAQYATQDYKFNYRNLFEWKLDGSIMLKQNQGVFFRPWLFHSIENCVVQYFRLVRKPVVPEIDK